MILLFAGLCWAHSPTIATFTLTEEAGVPALRLEAAQAAFDAAVGESASKEAIVAYVKQSVRIEADGQPLALGPGGLRLGDHVSALFLTLPALEAGAELELKLMTFAENPAQTNLLRVDGSRWVLTPDNGFTATVPTGSPEPGGAAQTAGGVLVLAALGLALGRPV